ncbi:MAG: malonyl-CoA decarboxylase family protein [Gammaproteobacteria bacterium]|nr:malonyl-CoA decarboxylase family protein [Gammaproteobacteria bacterium]MDX2488727.1 malonyl-CoA decarboxylase family protein [Gammaproteobacteria bacterium]
MGWLEQVIDTVAERSLELLGLGKVDQDQVNDEALCSTLLSREGEASNIALAHQILQRYVEKNDEEKTDFLLMLAVRFDPDTDLILSAVSGYDADSPETLQQLIAAVEPPRQELFRRLNMAPRGTASLINLRRDLLQRLAEYPRLRVVDADLQHLFSSWFNRGFLVLESIDWNSSAAVLEKLIQYETVHPIAGWDDLHRRLQSDRLCFAFFHPALPSVPLIFVEVAFTNGITASIDEIIGTDVEAVDPANADTAIFYSINNSLSGLRGISFGNFLIKQVVAELQSLYPQLKQFCTLSPMPLFREMLKQGFAIEQSVEPDAASRKLLGDRYDKILTVTNTGTLYDAVLQLIELPGEHVKLLQEVLHLLSLCYLTQEKNDGSLYDPVARFHLSNGARIERINILANPSESGISESFGCMVNYLYDPDDVISNHEAFISQRKITMSKALQKAYDRMQLTGD